MTTSGSGSAECTSGSPTQWETGPASVISPWSAVASKRPTGAIAWTQAITAAKASMHAAAASSGPLAVRRMPKP